jgi:hypothetical protein
MVASLIARHDACGPQLCHPERCVKIGQKSTSVKRRYFVGIASVANPGALISPDGLLREERQR